MKKVTEAAVGHCGHSIAPEELYLKTLLKVTANISI